MLSFQLGGCRLNLHFSCFALLAFCCLFAGFTGGAFLLLAVSLHECAHLAVLFFFRAPPKSAGFSALGCRLELAPGNRLSYWQNAAVSLAGPAVNLLCFALLALCGLQEHGFSSASLALGAFHILPIEPLDGGLALRAFLCGFLDERKARKTTFFISLLLLLPMASLGFLVLLRTRYNFSLLAMSVYLMLYLLLKRDFFGG